MAPVRVSLACAPAAVRWPRYCACCLLALDDPGPANAGGLPVPWCEDCRRHVGMRRVDRFARWGRFVSWGLFGVLLALGLSPVLVGRPRWLTLGVSGTFLFLGLGLTAAYRLRLEDRKESCTAFGPPVRRLSPPAAGLALECDNPDFASLLVEANPGARRDP